MTASSGRATGVLTLLAALVCALTLLAAPAAASRLSAGEKRVALVIGNSTYRNVPALKNAAGDAEAIAATLQKLGFAVTAGIDLDRAGFDAMLAGFRETARNADAVVLYYSGHAFQLEGVNHLVPTDAVLRSRERIAVETISLDDIIPAIQSPSRPTLIFLDACRNNPLPSKVRSTEGNGLARIQSNVANLYIAFATAPDAVTDDGIGEHSPFASALMKNLPRSGMSVGDMMTYVTDAVSRQTLGKQQPWAQGSMSRVFYFNPREDEEPVDTAVEDAGTEDRQVALNVPAPSLAEPSAPAVMFDPADEGGDVSPAPASASPPALPVEPSGPANEFSDIVDEAPTVGGRLVLAPSGGGRDQVIAVLRPGDLARSGAAAGPASAARAIRLDPNEIAGRNTPQADTAVNAPATATRAASAVPAAIIPRAQPIALLRIEGRDAPEPQKPALELVPAAPAASEETQVAMVRPDNIESDVTPLDDDGESAGLPAPLPAPAVPVPDDPASPRDLARETQAELSRLGCYSGSIDGDWSARSVAALQRFFDKAGEAPSGQFPSAEILELLRGEADGICKAALTKPEPPKQPQVDKPRKPQSGSKPPKVQAKPQKPQKPQGKAQGKTQKVQGASKPSKPQSAPKAQKPKAKPKPTIVKSPKPAAPPSQKPKLSIRGIGA